jgi:hypothetical protein
VGNKQQLAKECIDCCVLDIAVMEGSEGEGNSTGMMVQFAALAVPRAVQRGKRSDNDWLHPFCFCICRWRNPADEDVLRGGGNRSSSRLA